MRYTFEKIGVTSDYYIIDSTVEDWEESIVAVVTGLIMLSLCWIC